MDGSVSVDELRRVLASLTQPDAAIQRQGLHFVDQLKNSPDGWKLCTTAILTADISLDPAVQFYCLQVMEHYIQSHYIGDKCDNKMAMRTFIQKWTERQCESPAVNMPMYLSNKMAQLCGLVFVRDYPDQWPHMLLDLLALTQLGAPAVELFLRTLLYIDSEIVDREIVHSAEEQARNTIIKDTMRLQCVPQLVASWLRLIPLCRPQQPHLSSLCLDVVGKYISWIDLSLVANEQFVSILRQCLQHASVRQSAVDCIHDIVQKGMEPLSKARLVESFYCEMQTAGVFELAASVGDDSPADDVDFLCRLGRLLSALGCQLIQEVYKRLAKTESSDSTVLSEVDAAIRAKLPHLLTFLNCEYDEPSLSVFDFVRDYVQLLKTKPGLDDSERKVVGDLTLVLIRKMKFSTEYNFDEAGEDEADFEEYRKRLKVLYDNLAGACRDLVLSLTEQYVVKCLDNWKHGSMADVEAAVSMLYMLGEALPPVSTGNFFSDDPAKVSVLQNLMEKLVSSDVVQFPHHVVPFQYFETIVRYDKFFVVHSELLPKVLGEFLGEFGINHPRARNSGRAVYLFSRFVRSLRAQMELYTEQILQQLVPLLSVESSSSGSPISRDDQLYLYETVAVLIVSSVSASNKLKCERLQSLLSTSVAHFVSLVMQLDSVCDTSVDTSQIVKLQLTARHAINIVSRTTKAFSSSQTMRMVGASPIYLQYLQTFLRPLQSDRVYSVLQSSTIQYLHRLLVCTEDEIVPVFRTASDSLLKNIDLKRLQEYLPLVNQVVAKHKTSCLFATDIVPYLTHLFWPLCQLVCSFLTDTTDCTDEMVRERQTLGRAYLLFLSTLVSNSGSQVLAAQPVERLHAVLLHIVQAAVDSSDPVAQKSCFLILRRLTEVWAGAHTDNHCAPALYVPFLYEHVVPACFLAPVQPNFDLSDAQTILALQESASCLRAIYQQRGDELVAFLQQRYMKDILNVKSDRIQEYCNALRSDNKAFKNYTKIFFQMSRS